MGDAIVSEAGAGLSTVTVRQQGRVAELVLNRPDKLNAIDKQMLGELRVALERIAASPDIRVTVLSGAGRSFCAGFDVGRPAPETAGYAESDDPVDDFLDLRDRLDRLFDVWRHPKPVIAAVHGNCLGAGTVLAALADITLVTPDARIGIPTLPLGGGMLTPTWVHLVGPKRAKQIAFEIGGAINGSEAEAWGFANYCVPGDRLQAEALDLAARFARTPASLLVLKKAAINRMVELSGFTVGAQIGALTDSLAHEARGLDEVRRSVRERGVRQTVADFRAGLLDD
jgi:enoyl-CoA hydratase